MKKEHLIIYFNIINLTGLFLLHKAIGKENLPFVIGLLLTFASLSSIWLAFIAWTRGTGIFVNQGSRNKSPFIFFTYILGYLFLGTIGIVAGLWLIYSFFKGNVNINL